MISSQPSILRSPLLPPPPPPPPLVIADARTSYVPGLRLSAAGGATATVTLFDSSSRANARLSAAGMGQPAGAVTAARAAIEPRVRLVVVTVKCRGSRDPPSIGHSSSS